MVYTVPATTAIGGVGWGSRRSIVLPPANEKRNAVNIDKAQIVAALQARNQPDRAAWVDRQLPDVIDQEKNQSLLTMLGIDVKDLPPLEEARRPD
jgi:hypothetical protein